MKKNNTNNLTLLFISHIYIYSFTYILLYNLIRFIKTDFFILKDFLIMSILSPLSVMYIGDIPFFIILIPIFYLIIKYYFKFNQSVFKTYLISVVIVNGFMYLIMLFNSKNYIKLVGRIDDQDYIIDKLFFIIPSIAITILVNKWFFRNKL